MSDDSEMIAKLAMERNKLLVALVDAVRCLERLSRQGAIESEDSSLVHLRRVLKDCGIDATKGGSK